MNKYKNRIRTKEIHRERDETFYRLNDSLLYDKTIPAIPRLVMMEILKNKDYFGISQTRISDRLGFSKSTVDRAIKKLIKLGNLEKEYIKNSDKFIYIVYENSPIKKLKEKINNHKNKIMKKEKTRKIKDLEYEEKMELYFQELSKEQEQYKEMERLEDNPHLTNFMVTEFV